MQKFKFPMEFMRVTQGENGSYSHAGSLAMDFGGKDTGADKLYCPCDMVVKRCRKNANGELYLESTLPVEFADGTKDYARLLCLHDSTFNVVEGQVLKQGDYFYDEGGMGSGNPKAFGTHVHMEAGKGKWNSTTQSANSQGTYVIENQSHLYDLFILGDDVRILDGGGYSWKTVSDLEKKDTEQAVVYGADVSHHQTEDCVQLLGEGGKLDFIIQRAMIGSESRDKLLECFAEDIKKYGFKNGCYVAAYAKDKAEAVEEADARCAVIAELGNPVDLPVFYDWEYFSAKYIKEQFGIETTPWLVRDITEAFCERVKERGYVPGVYANKDFVDNYYTESWLKEKGYKLWYARPGYDSPDKDCYMWQYASDNAAEFNYNAALDQNILIGDYIDGTTVTTEAMKPLVDGLCRMKIGFASEGDIKKLVTKIEGLGIACEATEGYIITGEMSKGDQCYVMVDCNALGVLYEVYNPQEPEEEPVQCESCEKLKAELASYKAGCEQLEKDVEFISEKYESRLAEVELLRQQNAELFNQAEKLKKETAEKLEIASKQVQSSDYYIEQLKIEKANLEADVDRLKTEIAAMVTEKGVLKETIASLTEQLEEAKHSQPQKKCLLEKILDILFGGE